MYTWDESFGEHLPGGGSDLRIAGSDLRLRVVRRILSPQAIRTQEDICGRVQRCWHPQGVHNDSHEDIQGGGTRGAAAQLLGVFVFSN